jgi:hypothetical protein
VCIRRKLGDASLYNKTTCRELMLSALSIAETNLSAVAWSVRVYLPLGSIDRGHGGKKYYIYGTVGRIWCKHPASIDDDSF